MLRLLDFLRFFRSSFSQLMHPVFPETKTPFDWQTAAIVAACCAFSIVCWMGLYLTVPYPAIFGDEFGTYATTRTLIDPSYNLQRYAWLYQLRGAFSTYGWVYQLVHLRDNNPLAYAQLLNAICVGASLPCVWVVARSLLPLSKIYWAVVAYAVASVHALGALFVVEPLFLLSFWITATATLYAAKKPFYWAYVAGSCAAWLVSIKPHGLLTALWSLSLVTFVPYSIGESSTWKKTAIRILLWGASFFFVTVMLRRFSGGSSGDTLAGKGFYGEVLTTFAQPSAILALLSRSFKCAALHLVHYGLFFGTFCGVIAFNWIAFLCRRPRLRLMQAEDWMAMSFAPLTLGVFMMTLAYSSYVNETHRIHGRYWGYTLLPLSLAAWRFIKLPLYSPGWLSRLLPGFFTFIAAAGLWWAIPLNLQITPNDCPEVAWLYLGEWRPEWQRGTVYTAIIASSLVSAWVIARPSSGWNTVVRLFIVLQITSGLFAINFFHRNSISQGVQNRMSTVLQTFEAEISADKVIIVAPKFGLSLGAQFGLHRIISVLEKPTHASIDPSLIPSNVTVVATITHYALPGDWRQLWKEGEYAVFQRTDHHN